MRIAHLFGHGVVAVIRAAPALILLVHRDERVRAALQRVLEPERYDIDHASDERRALRALRRRRYDLVMTDLLTSTGRSLVERIGQERGEVPIVVIAGSVSLSTLVDAIDEGAWDFVDATARPREILDVVRSAIAYGRLRVQVRSLENAGGVMNTTAYERVMRNVHTLAAGIRREKKNLRARARRHDRLPA